MVVGEVAVSYDSRSMHRAVWRVLGGGSLSYEQGIPLHATFSATERAASHQQCVRISVKNTVCSYGLHPAGFYASSAHGAFTKSRCCPRCEARTNFRK